MGAGTSLGVVVVPAAGLGTRMRAVTGEAPKELLPLGGRPVLAWLLEEIAAAGAARAVVVGSAAKPALTRWLEGEAHPLPIEVVLQPRPLGLGDALLCAAPALDADAPFGVALGDAPIGLPGARSDVLARLAAARAEAGAASAVAVRRVPRAELHRYGVVAPAGGGGATSLSPVETADPGAWIAVADLVEKPPAGTAPSELAVSGRYVVTPAVLDALRARSADEGRELGVTGALRAVGGVVAVALRGDEPRFDIGDPATYADARHAYADGARLSARVAADGE